MVLTTDLVGYFAEAVVQHFWSAWIGGQGVEPYEQNTQQSPGLGFNSARQLVHS